MPLMTWTDDLTLGIKSIDDQHKQLIDMINELFHAMQNGSPAEDLQKILSELHDYTFYHFTHEEELMKKFHYPAYESHKKGHDGFIRKINEFDRELVENDESLSPEILKFLSDWIENHIKVVDVLYTDLLIAKNVE